jgi:hypothetical protein
MIARRLSLGLAITLALASAALAHHGWSWAEAEKSTTEGTITTISMVPPHPALTVTDAEGTVWQIELGNPGRVQRAGFTQSSAKPGDAVTILGNRSLDASEKVMKAVRITLAGQNYDFYPERLGS